MLIVGSGLALWTVPWLAWPTGSGAVTGETARKPTVFRYIKGARGLDGSTWSPVLMPLPTSDGFSKKAAVKEMPKAGPVPVLKPGVPQPSYLDLSPPALPVLEMPGMASLPGGEFEPEIDSSKRYEESLAGRDTGIQVDIPGELKARGFTIPAIPVEKLAETELSTVTVTAYVELDRKGRVQHLLLEQPSGVPAVDALLIRDLRAGVGAPGTGLASGRVKLYYWKTDRVEKE